MTSRLAKSLLATTTVAIGFALTAMAAQASYYVPKAHHACRAGYRRETVRVREHHHGKVVRRHGRVVWVKQVRCVIAIRKPTVTAPAPTATSPKVTYQARVDPTFVQSATDPLAVTYAYSADATQVSGAQTTDLAQAGQLPGGVLNFYSAQTPGGPESLYCSMNVGGATDGGSCPITYSATGTYAVTTEYIPTAASAVTETDQETIAPFATTTTLTVTPGACGTGFPPGYETVSGPWCEYTLAIGVVDQNGARVGGRVALSVTPGAGGATEGNLLPANGSCTVYVTASWVLSSDCNFTEGSGLLTETSWSLTAAYAGQPGWAASQSSPLSLAVAG